MEDKKIDNKSLTEVYVILNELGLYKNIPKEFQEFIIENKNNDYSFSFDKKMPLFNQLKNDNTRVLLSYIYVKYINNNSLTEKFMLNEVMEIIEKINK